MALPVYHVKTIGGFSHGAGLATALNAIVAAGGEVVQVVPCSTIAPFGYEPGEEEPSEGHNPYFHVMIVWVIKS